MTGPSPLRAVAQAHHGAGTTETAARDRIAPKAGSLRARALVAIVAAGGAGLTATEATEAIGLPLDKLYSVAPRLSELKRLKYVFVHGRWSNRQVYIATDAGRAWVAAQESGVAS